MIRYHRYHCVFDWIEEQTFFHIISKKSRKPRGFLFCIIIAANLYRYINGGSLGNYRATLLCIKNEFASIMATLLSSKTGEMSITQLLLDVS